MTSPTKRVEPKVKAKTTVNAVKPTSKMPSGIPSDHAWWTIPQTLAWIMHRNYAAIDTIPVGTSPFDILVDFIGTEADGGDRSQRLKSTLVVRDDFLANVKSGKLVVWASRTTDGPMEAVSAADWLTIDALAGNNPNFPPDALGGNYDDSPRYNRAAISGADVAAVWPPHHEMHTSDLQIQQIIEEAIRVKGDRLSIDEIDELELKNRMENSTAPQREKFRNMQITLRGAGKRGRKPKK